MEWLQTPKSMEKPQLDKTIMVHDQRWTSEKKKKKKSRKRKRRQKKVIEKTRKIVFRHSSSLLLCMYFLSQEHQIISSVLPVIPLLVVSLYLVVSYMYLVMSSLDVCIRHYILILLGLFLSLLCLCCPLSAIFIQRDCFPFVHLFWEELLLFQKPHGVLNLNKLQHAIR